MGDAADDAFEAMQHMQDEFATMFAAGCKPCPNRFNHSMEDGMCDLPYPGRGRYAVARRGGNA